MLGRAKEEVRAVLEEERDGEHTLQDVATRFRMSPRASGRRHALHRMLLPPDERDSETRRSRRRRRGRGRDEERGRTSPEGGSERGAGLPPCSSSMTRVLMPASLLCDRRQSKQYKHQSAHNIIAAQRTHETRRRSTHFSG